MAYRENVSELAAKLGFTNDPGLREEDLEIAELVFTTETGEIRGLVASDMNRGARLFFQDRAARTNHVLIDEKFRRDAAEFFAELWEPEPVPGKRKLLDAIRASRSVTIIRKS